MPLLEVARGELLDLALAEVRNDVVRRVVEIALGGPAGDPAARLPLLDALGGEGRDRGLRLQDVGAGVDLGEHPAQLALGVALAALDRQRPGLRLPSGSRGSS